MFGEQSTLSYIVAAVIKYTYLLICFSHKREKTQWNHPIYVKIMEELGKHLLFTCPC